VFAALIHDVDHRGISNARLIEEEQQMGELYRGKSVAGMSRMGSANI